MSWQRAAVLAASAPAQAHTHTGPPTHPPIHPRAVPRWRAWPSWPPGLAPASARRAASSARAAWPCPTPRSWCAHLPVLLGAGLPACSGYGARLPASVEVALPCLALPLLPTPGRPTPTRACTRPPTTTRACRCALTAVGAGGAGCNSHWGAPRGGRLPAGCRATGRIHAHPRACRPLPSPRQVTTNGYADFKLLDVSPWTPACVSASKSAALNAQVACADACLLNRWSFQVRAGLLMVARGRGWPRAARSQPQRSHPTPPHLLPHAWPTGQGISWAVTSGSDIFGWSKK